MMPALSIRGVRERVVLASVAIAMVVSAPGPARAQDAGGAESVADLFARVNPAVVTLHTVERESNLEAPEGEVASPGLGSGFLVDGEGHVVTAAHVVQTADAVEAEFSDGTRVSAEILASDPLSDLALLRVASIPVGVEPVPLGDSEIAAVGEQVVVVGAPYGLSHSLTVGHLSGRHLKAEEGMDLGVEFLQTDAAINQGNSGGPMFNMQGEVIGIVSYILSQSGGFEGLGFAVASNAARAILFERPRFWSGLTGLMLDGDLARVFNLPQESGFLVQKVARGSPAEEAGLQPGRVPITILDRTFLIGGDIILSVDRIPLTADRYGEIREHLATLNAGGLFRVQILRGGRRMELVGVR